MRGDALQAGADLVQIYTGLIYRGPELVSEIRATVCRVRKVFDARCREPTISTSAGPTREQADRDHADELIDRRLQRHRVGDLQAVHVEDLVAVVGDEPLAIDRLSAEPHQLRATYERAIGITSTGSGNVPSTGDQLGFVDDADEAARCGGDDLLARQRAAAALDQVSAARRTRRRRRCTGRGRPSALRSRTSMPCCLQTRGGALGTRDGAPMRTLRAASASMK